tara:strand:+ start:32089 stop:32835 length:747 start_codon:yes stop_codon:yes gene_type:complete
MKKIIWIDVGTHFAQEHGSIFSSNISFYLFLFRRLFSSKFLRRGKFVSLLELKEIIKSRQRIRKYSSNFYSIFIEANHKIARKRKFYPNADIFFNIALTNDSYQPISIAKLYLGDGRDDSQGSSIFLEKHNVTKNDFVAAFGSSTNNFFQAIEEYLSEQFNDYVVMLRLNCEGVEDDVIYSAHNSFGKKLQLISGSLKDVSEVKGVDAYEKLNNYMNDNEIIFAKFYAPIYSWLEGHKAIIELLRKVS